jgi:hypothetical protein
MSRAASILLLLVGTLLCVTWIGSPAMSAPQSRTTRPPTPDPTDRSSANPTVEAIALAPVTPARRNYTPPRRNPFTFDAPAAPALAPVTPDLPAEPVRASVTLPSLVAIVKDTSDDRTDRYRAAVSSDRLHVTLVQAGATYDGFDVVEVRADSVLIRHTNSSDLFRLALQ